jgi:arsenate reductase-like glutaredoxin family protein
MVRDDLRAERLAAIEVMERTIDSDRLSEEELLAWLSAINDLRLVLGTRLDVPEDLNELDVQPGDPRAESLALYAYLSILEEDAVAALS